MKKFIGSIVTICSLFMTINAMKFQPISNGRVSALNQAIINHNLLSVFTHIDCVQHSQSFFNMLSIADKYWLLLATLNNILNARNSSLQGTNCINILLCNLYTFFGYKTFDEFNKKHRNTTFFNFLVLFVENDIEKVMTYAVNHNFEMIMYLIFNDPDMSKKAFSLSGFQLQNLLSSAIKNGYVTVARTIIDAWIPYLFKKDDKIEELIKVYIEKPFLCAVELTKLHPQSIDMIDVFLDNDSIANNLSFEFLNEAKTLISNNKAKKLVENLIYLRKLVDSLTSSDSKEFNH